MVITISQVTPAVRRLLVGVIITSVETVVIKLFKIDTIEAEYVDLNKEEKKKKSVNCSVVKEPSNITVELIVKDEIVPHVCDPVAATSFRT